MKSNLEKSDSEIKMDVLAELQYEPSIEVADIGVLVKDGEVTLNGYATCFGEKLDAVRAARRVAGVKFVADEVQVRLPDSLCRSDGEIAAAAANQIDCSTTIPRGTIGITVRDGSITLEGVVDRWYQKSAAEDAVLRQAGIKTLINRITIKTQVVSADVETAIKLAFERNALFDARKIQVETTGSKVVLRGLVRNHTEREEAERVAWAASGVASVDNQLKVDRSLDFAE
jgi:osmotically-inducible protein OsmY